MREGRWKDQEEVKRGFLKPRQPGNGDSDLGFRNSEVGFGKSGVGLLAYLAGVVGTPG